MGEKDALSAYVEDKQVKAIVTTRLEAHAVILAREPPAAIVLLPPAEPSRRHPSA